MESKFLSAVNAVKCFCFVFHKAEEREREKGAVRERKSWTFLLEVSPQVCCSQLLWDDEHVLHAWLILGQPAELMADGAVESECVLAIRVWMKGWSKN